MQYEIDKVMKIPINGLKQKIHIKSADTKNPILLCLHGGPGVTNRGAIMTAHADLANHFTLVAWDQRGTGGSYWGADHSKLTIDSFVQDARELADWLCKKFNKQKLFILGGSWGSELGTWLAFRYPERIGAYVGFGQLVSGADNERLSYKFAHDEAEAAGDAESIKLLESVGPPENGTYKGGLSGLMKQRKVMMKYGGYSKNPAKRSHFKALYWPMITCGEFTPMDLYGVLKGNKKTLESMWPQVGATDLAKTCTEFKVPYFVFDGRLDNNTPAALVQDYFDIIKAPLKELIWFEDAGHNPMTDDGPRFKALLREKLLPIPTD